MFGYSAHSLTMLFSRRKPQLLGAFGALLLGGQSAQAIQLDLSNTGEKQTTQGAEVPKYHSAQHR